MHAAIYPTLPLENKVIYKKYNDYKYIKVKLPNGTTTAMGLPWINMSTVQVITTRTARFTVTLDNPYTSGCCCCIIECQWIQQCCCRNIIKERLLPLFFIWKTKIMSEETIMINHFVKDKSEYKKKYQCFTSLL